MSNQLLNQLRQFGLNPDEWHLIVISQSLADKIHLKNGHSRHWVAELHHRDGDLSLQGIFCLKYLNKALKYNWLELRVKQGQLAR